MTRISMVLKTMFLLLLALAAFTPAQLEAQQRLEDVVYLHNGSVVRGTITEQVPGKRITIRTRDGSEFVYVLSDVTRITKESVYAERGVSNSDSGLYKDPGTATLLSLACPGCGQLWAGETGKGLIIMGASLGSIIVGGMTTSCGVYTCSGTPILLGSLGMLGAWGYGVYDAGGSARKVNALHVGVAFTPVVNPDTRSVGVGFRLSLNTH